MGKPGSRGNIHTSQHLLFSINLDYCGVIFFADMSAAQNFIHHSDWIISFKRVIFLCLDELITENWHLHLIKQFNSLRVLFNMQIWMRRMNVSSTHIFLMNLYVIIPWHALAMQLRVSYLLFIMKLKHLWFIVGSEKLTAAKGKISN